MLRVEVDIFSGRPNPTWIVTSDTVTNRIIAALKSYRSFTAGPENRFQGLGFRGVEVQVVGASEWTYVAGRLRHGSQLLTAR